MRFTLISFFIILLFPVSLSAGMLVGRIVSIDPDKSILLLAPQHCRSCPPGPPPCPCPDQPARQADADMPPTMVVLTGPVPCYARPGSFVRIWGEFGPDKRFLAQRIAGPGRLRGQHDSTGVRSRLRKRCLMNEHRPGPDRP